MKDRPEFTTSGRQLVQVPAEVVGVGDAVEDAVADQLAQPLGKHRLGNIQVNPEVAESSDSVEGVPDDQQRPTLTDHPERAGDGAVLTLIVLAEHAADCITLGSIIELKVIGSSRFDD